GAGSGLYACEARAGHGRKKENMTTNVTADIVVAGSGPAGLTAALALARAGFSVTLVGPQTRLDDRRTTALMTPSLAFLQGLGIGEPFAGHAAPLRVMRIVDATTRLVRSPPVTFRAAEIGEDHFGLNIPNAHLNRCLADAVAADPAIDRKSTRLNSSHVKISYAVFCLKKKR